MNDTQTTDQMRWILQHVASSIALYLASCCQEGPQLLCPALIMSTVTQQAHTCGGNSRRRWPTGRPRRRRRASPSGPRRMIPPREARDHPIFLSPLRVFSSHHRFPYSAGYKRLMSDLSLSMPTLHASQQGRTAESSEHAVERTARRQNNKQTRQWEYIHTLS